MVQTTAAVMMMTIMMTSINIQSKLNQGTKTTVRQLMKMRSVVLDETSRFFKGVTTLFSKKLLMMSSIRF